jgi:hypothetical protein
MPAPVEHVVASPCAWCGRTIEQPPRGRRLRYCDRSCRQRAYEARTAQRRLQRDVDAGRIVQQPTERVVERVVQPRHPSTPAAWIAALDELTARVRDGRIQPWNAARIRPAVTRLQAALAAAVAGPSDPAPAASAPPVAPAGLTRERTGQLVARLAATSAGRTEPTTLARLAHELAVDVADVREVLAALVDVDAADLTRTGPTGTQPVDALIIAEHARFTVTLHS